MLRSSVDLGDWFLEYEEHKIVGHTDSTLSYRPTAEVGMEIDFWLK